MNSDLLIASALAALLVVVVVGLVWIARDRRRMYAALAAARSDAREALAEVAALRTQLAAVDPPSEAAEYVITHLGEEDGFAARDPAYSDPQRGRDPVTGSGDADGRIDGRLFADLVVRGTVVKAAAFGHGVRRAIAPESRNRIRFEMRREMKRSRRQRKDEFKQVRREMRDRQRATVSAE